MSGPIYDPFQSHRHGVDSTPCLNRLSSERLFAHGRIVGKPSNGPPVGSFNLTFRLGRYTARWALEFESHPGYDFSTDFERRPTELQAPTPNSLVRTHDASLREQVFYVTKF